MEVAEGKAAQEQGQALQRSWVWRPAMPFFRRANSGEKTLSPPSLRVEKRCLCNPQYREENPK